MSLNENQHSPGCDLFRDGYDKAINRLKLLIVTFPNDLGSRTIEANLVKFASQFADVRVFRFAAHDSSRIDKRLDNRRNFFRRIQDCLQLRSAVAAGVREGRKILFYNISPALFAYRAWGKGEAYITMDWARRLLADRKKPDFDPMTRIHRKVMEACKAILPMTDAMAECLRTQYRIEQNRIRQVPSLFDLGHFEPNKIELGSPIRLLFIGGDIVRKGGHILHSEFTKRLSGRCLLTMVTNAELPAVPGIKQVRGIRYGTVEHLEIMQNHDVLVLPTLEDAGPQVIGEAAAAGLAVFTTRYALGAPHVIQDGITGVIAEDAESCINRLADLIELPEQILIMRKKSLEWMQKHFSKEKITSRYHDALIS